MTTDEQSTMITKYGLDNFFVFLILAFLLIASGSLIRSYWLGFSFVLTGCLLIGFALLFFRDPPRCPPKEAADNPAAVLAPADGRIVAIQSHSQYPPIGEAIQISIFLAVYDVHVNRSPVTGTVRSVEYQPGSFIAAFKDEASRKNEQTTIVVETLSGPIVFKQIVGILARRIVCDLQPGQQIRAGERFGMMKFGSRMDIFLPAKSQILVRKGEKVRAGETLLGFLPAPSTAQAAQEKAAVASE